MKILDWWLATFFHATFDNSSRRSRIGRANFSLWFFSSFIWAAIFFLLLILLKAKIAVVFFLPLLVVLFVLNYRFLRRIYIIRERGDKVIKEGTASAGFILFARVFLVFSFFSAMAMWLTTMVSYGKSIGVD